MRTGMAWSSDLLSVLLDVWLLASPLPSLGCGSCVPNSRICTPACKGAWNLAQSIKHRTQKASAGGTAAAAQANSQRAGRGCGTWGARHVVGVGDVWVRRDVGAPGRGCVIPGIQSGEEISRSLPQSITQRPPCCRLYKWAVKTVTAVFSGGKERGAAGRTQRWRSRRDTGDRQFEILAYTRKRAGVFKNQVAHQVAVAKGLRGAAQHRGRGRPIVLTVHNVTTARDLQAHRAGARRRTSHGQLARNNLSTLQGLNAQPGVTVTVRADPGPPPARLQRIADRAARSGNLRPMRPPDCASHANAPWDELRVWDPGD